MVRFGFRFAIASLTLALCWTNGFAQPPGRGGFGGPSRSGPRLKPTELKFKDGTATVPDRATFKKLSYQGPEVMIDRHLDSLEFVKFQIEDATTKDPQLYFMNTKTHRGHPMFMRAIGIGRGNRGSSMRGVLVYRPLMKAKNGQAGVYTFEFEPWDAYDPDKIRMSYDLLISKSPILKDRLGYYLMPGALQRYGKEKEKFDAIGIPIYRPEDIYADIAYLPLNLAEGFGRLRLMKLEEQPTPRDVVIYKSIPNEMPRVAGIITGARQTPLSHVNLRAIQDKVPNAFITDAWEDRQIKPLIGKYVYYRVASDGYEIREATDQEVEAHLAKMRPEKAQVPKRDLTVKEIRALGDLEFKDSASVGVKASNLAAMKKFELPKELIPNGFAVPFYFYDEFMKHNGFYDQVVALLKDPNFLKDRDLQQEKLKDLRKQIEKGEMPEVLKDAIKKVQKQFPKKTSLRCRSSTNNEDLPGFSGAGLYSSYTHKPSEGHLSKTIKQVYASLWNFRAFEEREFYRIDHLATAMGVLIHPNYKEEQANGVAVTDDILYQTKGNYYINTQVGEDLVTNPEEESVPEEILLDWWQSSKNQVMRKSNRVENGKRILTTKHLDDLRSHLSEIHAKFTKLYGVTLNEKQFAMEVEFKVTKDGDLVIKQARPWVFPKSVKTAGEGR